MDRPLEDTVHLAPMRIGEILDKSMYLLKRIFPQVAAPLALIAVLAVFQQRQQNQGEILSTAILAVTAAVLGMVVQFSALFLASDYWLGKNTAWREALSRLRLRYFLRSVAISISIGAGVTVCVMVGVAIGSLCFGIARHSAESAGAGVAALLFVAGVAAVILIAVVPAVVFVVNRLLAYYIALLEDSPAYAAMKRSKFLMNQGSKFSLRGPWMRVSGLMLVTTVVSVGVGMCAGAGVVVSTAFGAKSIIEAAIVFCGSMLTNAVYVFSSITMTGFYYDLRVRYEALDLIGTAAVPAATAGAAAQVRQEHVDAPTGPQPQ